MENFIKSKISSADEKLIKLWNSSEKGKENPKYYPTKVKRLTFGATPLQPGYLCLAQDELDLEKVRASEVTHIYVRGVEDEEECIKELGRLMKGEEAWGELYSIILEPKVREDEEKGFVIITEVEAGFSTLGKGVLDMVFNEVLLPHTVFVFEEEEEWMIEQVLKRAVGGRIHYYKVLKRETIEGETLYQGEVVVRDGFSFYSTWNGRKLKNITSERVEPVVVMLFRDLGGYCTQFKNIIYFPSIVRFNREGWRETMNKLRTKYSFGSVRSINRRYCKARDSIHLSVSHTLQFYSPSEKED